MRRIVSFDCEGDRLLGTIDEAGGATGVLVVAGGNEVRVGAHRGMALLAERLAAHSVPVFRFDRRGIGDSEGENRGWDCSAPDIAAALAAFRCEQPQVEQVVGFGNCDAATALALLDSACDALLLANPWLGNEDAALPPAALRAHYARRLRDPRAWLGILRRGLGNLSNLSAVLPKSSQQPLASRMATALASRPATIVLAARDRTAQVFAAAVRPPPGVTMVRLDTASHSFAGAGNALAQVVLDAVERVRKDREDPRSTRIHSPTPSLGDA